MAELTREHHDLPSMMALVGDEVGQDMRNVKRQVAPDVRFGRRHMASRFQAEREKIFDRAAASFESGEQLMAIDGAAIDGCRHLDAMFLAERLDPHAPGIMDVTSDHPNRAAWRTGNSRVPDGRREVL